MKNRILPISLISLFVIYCLALAVLAPMILRPMVSEQAKNFIHGSAEVTDIDINPLANSVSIEGLIIKNNEGNTLVSLDSAYVNLDILSLVALQLNVESLELSGLKVFSPESQLLDLPKANIANTAVRLLSQTVTIENININDLKLSPKLNKVGSNIETLLAEVEKLLITEDEKQANTSVKANVDSESTGESVTNETSTTILPEKTEDPTEQDPTTETEMALADKEPSASEEPLTNKSIEISETDMPVIEAEEETPWLIIINHFSLNKAGIELSDSMNADEALTTIISDINLNAQNIHSDFSQDVQFKLTLTLFDSDLVISGTSNPFTMNSAINYSLNQINLASANHYVESFSQASIKSGFLTSSGTIEISQAPESEELEIETENEETTISQETTKENVSEATDKLAESQQSTDKDSKNIETVLYINITNNTRLSDLNVAHQNFEQPLIKCPLIESNKLEIKLPANSLSLESLILDQCLVTVVLRKDGTSNTDLILEDSSKNKNDSKTEETQNKNESTEADSMEISVGTIKLNNNQIAVRDFTQGNEVNLTISPLNAEISNLSEGEKYLTQLSLDAKINKHAPLTIKGKGNFLNPKLSSDIQTKLDNMGLTVFSPYTLNLSSRPIEKGTLTLDIDIKIDENKLDSKNHALLTGFQLGKKQAHEGASKLPIALAVSVLRDNDGNINFDIPVKGDLDDPSFSVAKQVIKVLTNLITKAATAAFSIVGDAVSGENNTNSKELIFADNVSTLSNDQAKITQALATTLKAHPELALNIKSFIGQNEAATLTQEQVASLQEQRINAFKQSMMELGITQQQLVLEQNRTEIQTSTQAKLELSFFAF